jgi:uncharacterized membrane protein
MFFKGYTSRMPHNSKIREKIQCPVCKKEKVALEIFSGRSIRPALKDYIQKYSPEWNLDNHICLECLNKSRSDFVENSLLAGREGLSGAEKEVIEAIRNHELIALHSVDYQENLKLPDKLADHLAAFGGSWFFILGFLFIMSCWIGANIFFLKEKAFDPYPFILLNLVLSCIAALQAPVIMMSQNRKEAKDRARAEADFKTNLKAELEIRHLHIKLDQLITHQWHQLLEIQQVQLDMMKDAFDRPQGGPQGPKAPPSL